MINLRDLKDSPFSRCRSLALAFDCGLPIPFGYFFLREEGISEIAKEIRKHLRDRYFTIHPISNNLEIAREGEFFQRYSSKKVLPFLSGFSREPEVNGFLVLSTGWEMNLNRHPKAENLFFAIALAGKILIIEAVKESSELMYHHGEKEFSGTFDGNIFSGNLPVSIKEAVERRFSSILSFLKEFGNGIMECGIISGKFFFFEAKKSADLREDYNFISSLSEEIIGKAILYSKIDNPAEKYIILAETPNLELAKFIPQASAFIFERGSILSHFSIILREQKIPALIYPNALKLNGKKILISKTELMKC